MPIVPQPNRETRLNGATEPYINAHLTGDMFGANVAQANANLGKDLQETAKAAIKIQDTIEDAKVLEFSNGIDQWGEEKLYNKDTGYYYKSGKDAVGKSTEIMQDYDNYVKKYKSENRLSPYCIRRIDYIAQRKKARIYAGVNNHDAQQTNNWAKIEGEKAIDNSIVGMVHARNNPDEMAIQMNNGLQAVKWQGLTQKLDADTIEAMKKDYKSKAHEAVLNSYIQEGSLQAGQYFEQHKDEIKPEAQARYIGAIKNEEMKYEARNLANDIVLTSTGEEEAIKKAESIEDINLSNQVVSRVKRHYSEQEHFKNQKEREALNDFYTKAVDVAQNGGTLSYDDIPDNLDPQIKLSLINYVNKNGQPETDIATWEMLYDMSVNNAQGFAKEDLNKYRGFLSDSEYKSFVKKQQEIQEGKFYTQIKDDDKKIKAALKAVGLDKNSVLAWKGDKKDIAFSEIRAMTREFEARKGRSITDDELSNIINSLGYKDNDGVQIYKQLEKGMRERTGFIRDVINDFAYYQSKHNGELPPDNEKMKIINNRINQKVQEKKTIAQQKVDNVKSNALVMRNIAYTIPKPNEQKVLTYFADNQIPTIGNQLGLKLTVTSRYRNQPGSHHGEGRAADVSMSEHSVQNRIRIYEKILALPTIHAIGTSDPTILAHFKGNPKIVDERAYDRKHGTNHVNHAHITLINANPARPAEIKTANNTYKF